jgi:hypothetical protein
VFSNIHVHCFIPLRRTVHGGNGTIMLETPVIDPFMHVHVCT